MLLRNCRQSRSALPGTYSWEEKKEFIASNRRRDINVETINRLSDVCVDPKSNVGSVCPKSGVWKPSPQGPQSSRALCPSKAEVGQKTRLDCGL